MNNIIHTVSNSYVFKTFCSVAKESCKIAKVAFYIFAFASAGAHGQAFQPKTMGTLCPLPLNASPLTTAAMPMPVCPTISKIYHPVSDADLSHEMKIKETKIMLSQYAREFVISAFADHLINRVMAKKNYLKLLKNRGEEFEHSGFWQRTVKPQRVKEEFFTIPCKDVNDFIRKASSDFSQKFWSDAEMPEELRSNLLNSSANSLYFLNFIDNELFPFFSELYDDLEIRWPIDEFSIEDAEKIARELHKEITSGFDDDLYKLFPDTEDTIEKIRKNRELNTMISQYAHEFVVSKIAKLNKIFLDFEYDIESFIRNHEIKEPKIIIYQYVREFIVKRISQYLIWVWTTSSQELNEKYGFTRSERIINEVLFKDFDFWFMEMPKECRSIVENLSLNPPDFKIFQFFYDAYKDVDLKVLWPKDGFSIKDATKIARDLDNQISSRFKVLIKSF